MTNSTKEGRATLYANMSDTRGGSARARARNTLQCGSQRMKKPQCRETLDELGQRMLDALIEVDDSGQSDVGCSLSG